MGNNTGMKHAANLVWTRRKNFWWLWRWWTALYTMYDILVYYAYVYIHICPSTVHEMPLQSSSAPGRLRGLRCGGWSHRAATLPGGPTLSRFGCFWARLMTISSALTLFCFGSSFARLEDTNKRVQPWGSCVRVRRPNLAWTGNQKPQTPILKLQNLANKSF